MINGLGQKLEADIEAQIEAYIDDGTPKIPFATREDIGRTVDFAAGRNRYIGHLISIPTKSFKNMRVGLDCSNGSASSVAKSVFDAIGAKTYVTTTSRTEQTSTAAVVPPTSKSFRNT